MKSKPLYRIGDKTALIKQWAEEWGVSYGAARGRIMTLCAHKKAGPVRVN